MNKVLLGSLSLVAFATLSQAQVLVSKAPSAPQSKLVLAPAGEAKAYLGIRFQTDEVGVSIQDVLPGTPAAEAGMKAGDRIVRIGETTIDSREALQSAVERGEVGEQVAIGIVRAEKPLVLLAKLGERPGTRWVQEPPKDPVLHIAGRDEVFLSSRPAPGGQGAKQRSPKAVREEGQKKPEMQVETHVVIERIGDDGVPHRSEWNSRGKGPQIFAEAVPAKPKKAQAGCQCQCHCDSKAKAEAKGPMKGQAKGKAKGKAMGKNKGKAKGQTPSPLASMLLQQERSNGRQKMSAPDRAPKRMRWVFQRPQGPREGRMDRNRPDRGSFEGQVRNFFRGQGEGDEARELEQLRQELRSLREELHQLRQELDHGRGRNR